MELIVIALWAIGYLFNCIPTEPVIRMLVNVFLIVIIVVVVFLGLPIAVHSR